MDKNKCNSCGEPTHKCSCKNKDFTKAVIQINNPEQITLMRKVVIPASMGDDTTVPPVIGKYHNVLLNYEANNKSYLYSSDGIPTLLTGTCTCHKNLEYTLTDISTATWHAFFGARAGDVYFPASDDVTFTQPVGGTTNVASLWEKISSGEEVRLRIPLQAISDASASLVEEGYFKVNPMREITVELGPQHYYDYDNGMPGQDNTKVRGYMIESTSFVPAAGPEGPEDFLVGIVKVTQGGSSSYVFVTSLRQDRFV